MTILITIIIAFTVILLDWVAYKRLSKRAVSKLVKYSFVAITLVSNLLILLTPLLLYFFINEDNGGNVMKIAMIMLTTYLALSLPRVFFYLFWLPSKKKYFHWTGVLLSTALFLLFIYSIFITRNDYEVKRVQVECENLPPYFHGYSIAFISDIHIGSMLAPECEIKKIAEIIKKQNVNLVLFGGDIINLHQSELTNGIVSLLSTIKGRDGAFMALGNHDTGAYINNSTIELRNENIAALTQKMNGAGWQVLRDSTVYIERGCDSIAITGIDFSEELLRYKHSMDAVNGINVERIYNNVPPKLFNITISHLPQLWNVLSESGNSDLTLSGHIHSMQMKFFGFSPARFMYEYWSGLYDNGKGKLYINDGIGCVGFIARFGARPEITVIELLCR